MNGLWLEFDEFEARFVTANDMDTSFRDIKILCQGSYESFVGLTIVSFSAEINGKFVIARSDDFFLRFSGFYDNGIFHDYII